MFWYGTSKTIAGWSGIAKGGCLGFMERFSVYYERAYPSGTAQVPQSRTGTGRIGMGFFSGARSTMGTSYSQGLPLLISDRKGFEIVS